MQQRRFASARRRHQRHRLAGPDRQFGAVEDVQRDVALPVLALDRVQEQDRDFLVFLRRLDARRHDGVTS